MTDFDLALEMLDSPDSDKREKAVKMLARSGDREALYHLADAYKAETDPELRDLIQKAGRYLKKNLDAEQSAPATSAYTSSSSTSKVDTSDESYTSKWDYDEISKKKRKNKEDETSEPNNILILTFAILLAVCGFGFSFLSFDNWLDLSAMPMQDGLTLGETMSRIRDIIANEPNTIGISQDVHRDHVSRVTPTFGTTSLSFVLSGQRSVWSEIFNTDYLLEMAEYYTVGSYPTTRLGGQSHSLDGLLMWASFFSLMIGLAAFVIIWEALMGKGTVVPIIGCLPMLLQFLGHKVTWIFSMVSAIPCIIAVFHFYFSMIPRFMPYAINSLGIATTDYSPISILGPNFFLATLAALSMFFIPLLALTFYPMRRGR